MRASSNFTRHEEQNFDVFSFFNSRSYSTILAVFFWDLLDFLLLGSKGVTVFTEFSPGKGEETTGFPSPTNSVLIKVFSMLDGPSYPFMTKQFT